MTAARLWEPAPGSLVNEYKLVRDLGVPRAFNAGGIRSRRWLALEPRSLTDVCLYGFSAPSATNPDQSASNIAAALSQVGALDHPHILSVRGIPTAPTATNGQLRAIPNERWVVTPYTGSHDGLTTLENLLEAKGGQASPYETERAVTQILEAAAYAHARGHAHGQITMDQVFVCRRGSLTIELYGLERRLRVQGPARPETIRDEIRSIAAIGYQMITGLPAEEPMLPAARLVRRLSPAWSAWLDRGLDPAEGFNSAADAIAELPAQRQDAPEITVSRRARPILTGFRRVLPNRWASNQTGNQTGDSTGDEA